MKLKYVLLLSIFLNCGCETGYGPSDKADIWWTEQDRKTIFYQLLLTGIAHTDRHLSQINKIKLHKDYPAK